MTTKDDKVDECQEEIIGLEGLVKLNWDKYIEDIKVIRESLKDFEATMEVYSSPGPLDNKYSPTSVSNILGWDDLPSLENRDCVKVKLNDIEYELVIQRDCLDDIYVQLYRETDEGKCINLLSDFFRDKVSFNNLRLELVTKEDSSNE